MIKKCVLGVTAALSLAACGGLNYAMTNYSGVEVQRFAVSGTTYRIFDKPEENRLMITPTIGDAAAAGAIQGGTLGLSGDPLGPQSEFRAAAQAFLSARSRGCTISDGAKVVAAQYEFFYTCT